MLHSLTFVILLLFGFQRLIISHIFFFVRLIDSIFSFSIKWKKFGLDLILQQQRQTYKRCLLNFYHKNTVIFHLYSAIVRNNNFNRCRRSQNSIRFDCPLRCQKYFLHPINHRHTEHLLQQKVLSTYSRTSLQHKKKDDVTL